MPLQLAAGFHAGGCATGPRITPSWLSSVFEQRYCRAAGLCPLFGCRRSLEDRYTHIMKSHRKVLEFHLRSRMGFVNITSQVREALRESGIREGLCLVNSMHITSSVFINDDEPGLLEDYGRWLEKLAPFDPSPERYHHNRTGEDNGDAHHKRQVMGREVVVAVTRGQLDFGTWEQIFYGEFDGNRRKRVLVKIIGE